MSAIAEPLAQAREALAIAWPEGDHVEPNAFTEALAALDLIEQRATELQARAEKGERDSRTAMGAAERFRAQGMKDAERAEAAEQRATDMEKALERIQEQQPKTLDWLRANGIIFDGPLGTDPGNWEHVAFSIYSDLCETDSIARAALSAREEAQT